MSSLQKALSEYLRIRRALGTRLREPGQTLGHFVDFLDRQGASFITIQLAVRWAREPQMVQRETWARRLSMVRCFARWQSAFDPRTEVPPPRLLHAPHRRGKPYIYSDQDIRQLMAEAGHLPSAMRMRARTYVTLIGLLAATGLRPGEALALQVSDVDLEAGVLTIRQSKFGKSRFVPVDESTRTALAAYARARHTFVSRCSTEAFLVSERGTALQPCTARRTFARLCCSIGLRASPEGRRTGRGPRLQDLRHTFATRRLIEWYQAGADVQREMPKLTTYLGHAAVVNTYWYIEAIPELLQLATEHMTTTQTGGAR